MAFVFVGEWRKEAKDDDTGISVKDLGAKGPAIETRYWLAQSEGFDFEFSTHVPTKSKPVDGKQRVWLHPAVNAIAFLKEGSGSPVERKTVIDHSVAGIAFLFPTYFAKPFFFSRGPATAAHLENGRVKIEHPEAPGLWDADPAWPAGWITAAMRAVRPTQSLRNGSTRFISRSRDRRLRPGG